MTMRKEKKDEGVFNGLSEVERTKTETLIFYTSI